MSEENMPVTSVDDDGTVKLDFSANAVQEQSTDEVPVQDEPTVSGEVPEQNVEEPTPEPAREEEPVQEDQVEQLEGND